MVSSILAFMPLMLAWFGGYFQDGQSAKVDHTQTASVSGRVTIGDSPAVGVQVALVPEVTDVHHSISRAKTDQDGHYLADSLTSGYYTIQVVAPLMVVQGEGSRGRRVGVQESTKLDNIDFVLVPGGVITGRVTDGDGSPISDLPPTLKLVDEKGHATAFSPCPQESETDDRGIYRIYGLPPGRYILGFGRNWDGPTHDNNQILVARQLYPLTYYPGVVDETSSKTIEVTAGSEITSIDVSLTTKKSLFKATGTVIDADTGVPIAGAAVGHGRFWGKEAMGPTDSVRSDSDGRFKFDRLQTGKHFLRVSNDYSNSNNRFGDQANFEIADGDVSGLEIKVHHGSTISGLVVPATPNDEKVAQSLANREVYAIQLRANPDNGAVSMNWVAQAPITADRNFRLAGLPPGKYRLHLAAEAGDAFGILYIEVPGMGRLMNNAPFPPGSFDGDPIELGGDQANPDAQDKSGLRIAVGETHGAIQGQIKFEGGSLPQNAFTDVSIVMLPASKTRQYAGAVVDPDGRFVVRSLAPGQYVISAAAYVYPPSGQQGGGATVLARASETVSVADGQQTTVTLILKLGAKQ
jgi:5-hydroxyisourate hydrolase-like protein (transthyretin family)